ncbi:YddF family protein [Brevibacterium sp. PAMC21349]|nr:YddF family protein [Brevibacterium sp. PAMC21349]
MGIVFLNSLVMTNPGFYKAEVISLDEVSQCLASYGGVYKSFIGHESTALFLQELLEIKIEFNRTSFKQKKYQKAICFKLYERFPENKVLTNEELENDNYRFYLLTRLD